MKTSDKLFFSIYIEKIVNQGEDAKPLIVTKDTSILLGVFDGLGGAGSIQKYKINDDEKYKSGAYIASRTTKNAVKTYFNYFDLNRYLSHKFTIYSLAFFKEKEIKEKSLKSFINGLEDTLYESLEAKEKLYADESITSQLKSKSVNLLPTTMALLYVTHINKKRYVISFWAGDSRTYILQDSGLIQLTCDDIEDFDNTIEAVNSNAPMNNYINLSKKFTINYNFYEEKSLKQIYIASTDGAFEVFDTPLDFEFTLLETLQDSDNLKMWNAKIELILKAKQNDDISIVVYPLGFNDFEDIKNFYKERYYYLKTEILKLKEVDNAIDTLKEDLIKIQNRLTKAQEIQKEIQNQSWDIYKKTYLSNILYYCNSKRSK